MRDLLRPVRVEILLRPRPARRESAHPLLAPTAADRRNQRLSWTQRADRWIYSGEASLSLGGTKGLALSMRNKITKSFAL